MTERLSLDVHLTSDLSDFVGRKVASGQFETPEDLVRHSLESLRRDENDVETWLRDVVGPTYDSHQRNPSSALSIAEVLERVSQTL